MGWIILHKRILRSGCAVGDGTVRSLSPGPLCSMGRETGALILDDKEENMGSPK